MFALLPICQVRLVDIIVLCSHSMLTKLRTDTAHHLVCSIYTFPKQLHVSWKAHQAFIAAVDQLVVCQLVLRTDPDPAEDLIMDVSIQRIHQLRS